jgi:hypothetical protein
MRRERRGALPDATRKHKINSGKELLPQFFAGHRPETEISNPVPGAKDRRR